MLALRGCCGHPRSGLSRSSTDGPQGPHPSVPRDPVGEILIVRRDPRIAFRVVENQMNYAYLGDRLKSSAAENFPIFLADLCAGLTRPT